MSYRVASTHENGTTVEISVGYGTKTMKETFFVPNQADNDAFHDIIKAHINELKIRKTVQDAQKRMKRAQEDAARKEKLSCVKKLTKGYIQASRFSVSAPTIQQQYSTAYNQFQAGVFTVDGLLRQYGAVEGVVQQFDAAIPVQGTQTPTPAQQPQQEGSN